MSSDKHELKTIDLQNSVRDVQHELFVQAEQRGLGFDGLDSLSSKQVLEIIEDELHGFKGIAHEEGFGQVHQEQLEKLNNMAIACLLGIASIKSRHSNR